MSAIASRAAVANVGQSGRTIDRTAVISDSNRLDAGLALVRVVTGLIFFAHGAQKVFVYGIGGVTESFASMGMPLAGIVAPLVAFGELFGGLALILGLLTRVAGAALVPIMLGALFIVHAPAGFFLPNGYEFVLLLAGIAGGLALTGGGSYSADAAIARRRQ